MSWKKLVIWKNILLEKKVLSAIFAILVSAKKLASSAMKASRGKKPMRLEDTIARGCFVLLNIPHGKKTKTFSYKKYGGREQARQAAQEHMQKLQPSTAGSPA